jgi:hypothetical protein
MHLSVWSRRGIYRCLPNLKYSLTSILSHGKNTHKENNVHLEYAESILQHSPFTHLHKLEPIFN